MPDTTPEQPVAGHTAGPWEVVTQPWADEDAKGQTVYSNEGYGICRVWDENGKPENAANARLITSAPDLLEALVTITDVLAAPTLNRDAVEPAYQKAMTAIARATGALS